MKHNSGLIAAAVAVLGVSASLATVNTFEDVTLQTGLNDLTNLYDKVVTWCDVNRDGWVDLYCAGSLWINQQGQAFEKMDLPYHMSLIAHAGVWGNFDDDEYPDFFNFRSRRLFINQNGTGFTDMTSSMLPTIESRNSQGAVCGDFNGDGFDDLYIGGYEDWDNGITYPDTILLNRNGEYFDNVWSETRYRARGIVACDFDQDNDLDIYVSNYRLLPNLLWVNDGTGLFTDGATEYNVVSTENGYDGGHSIGAAWGDLDNDGLFDLFSGNFSHHSDYYGIQPESDFFRNQGPENNYYFEDLGTCGVSWQESYASPALGDFDNDGFLDLYFTTVYGETYNQDQSVLYLNNGDWTFTDITADSGIGAIIGNKSTYMAAWADFDNDGQLDLITGGRLLRNTGSSNAWLKVRPVGTGEISPLALGTQVRLTDGTSIWTRQVECATGQGNGNEHTLHFGLGSDPALPLKMTILWPDGTEQKALVREVNRTLVIEKTTGSAPKTSILSETFETAQGMSTGDVAGQNNWTTANGTNAVVQTDTVYAGTQALQIEQATAARTQRVENDDVWIRFRARISAAPTSRPDIANPEGIVIQVNTDRSLIVYSNSAPVSLDASIPLDQWTTFDIYANRQSLQWSLALNGTNVAEKMICTSLPEEAHALAFKSSSTSSLYVDQIEIFGQEPSDLPDSDQDGLPDWWELKYADSVFGADPSDVTPGGLTFLQAYALGAAPTSNQILYLSAQIDSRKVAISWDAQLGRRYDVEWTDDLQSNFVTIATNISLQSEFIDYNSTTNTGFYRLKVHKE
ncbi:CRTAC1 family protein [Tichowtungia aerotolerans]|uniref:ASPIC/UnbV domain-containing protein n=1 Tax=Tichowtungia aerotolerans TaxID=2697043 RepID=A0A6P1MFE0_9BACT|nr:CRTAC1 family protein [Tichowtungia aerotolerans]QHI69785.1 hypothetical protein GT409_10100 [Tichowtungia aerotolerans]